jgi:nucleoside-diphosphate-sugar epimerase
MSLTIAVLGANGVYGRQLLPRLVARGHHVRALVRRPDAAANAAACGAEVRAADVFDAASLRAGLAGCDVAVNLATSLPSPAKVGGDFAENDRVRREGTPIWIRACEDAGVPRVLQQSIAMVNGAGDAWADEDTAFVPPANPAAVDAIAAALAMEAMVRASRLEWLVLRGGLFYGPGTGFDEDWFARARAGKLRLPGEGTDWVSLVHVADMAAATVLALDRWPARRALIVADDRPVQWRELLSFVAASVAGPPPPAGGRPGLPSFRVRNQRACEALAWRPFHADFRVGLAR